MKCFSHHLAILQKYKRWNW